jgi:hypothetical protein
MGAHDLTQTQQQFSALVFAGVSDKGEPYPPSIKANVVVTGKDKSQFFEYSPTPPLRSLIPGELEGTCSMTAVLHLAWIFGKRGKKGTEYSVRCTMFQGIVESTGTASIHQDGCTVVI